MKLGIITAIMLVSCANAPPPTAAQQADVVKYGAEEQACVVMSSTRAQADACILKVQMGQHPIDAGADQ